MRRHFNLTELVVIAVVAAVTAVIPLSAVSAARDQAKETSCTGNLKQLALAESQYAEANNGCKTSVTNNAPYDCGYLGSPRQLGSLYKFGYCTEPAVFYCPGLQMLTPDHQISDPAQWDVNAKKSVFTGYWDVNWHNLRGKQWEYESFKLAGPFPEFSDGSKLAAEAPSQMPIVMDYAFVWKTINPGGYPHNFVFNAAYADGSVAPYTDGNRRIVTGWENYHNIWLAPDVLMQTRYWQED